jgi:hypothetical protein
MSRGEPLMVAGVVSTAPAERARTLHGTLPTASFELGGTIIGLKLDRYDSGGASHPTCPPKPWRRRKLRNLGSIVAVRSEGWWTRSQRIRTEGEIPFEVALVDFRELPTYQRIAEKVFHLNQLGMNPNRIAVLLGVDRTTVTRSLRWILTLDE